MSTTFSNKIIDLRSRRLGLDRDPSLWIERSTLQESYESRTDRSATKYTLGAMQEVTPRYTQISHEECERIANQLTKNLQKTDVYCEYRMQGSVPTNTHIQGISDVDFLVILTSAFYFDDTGKKSNSYRPYHGNIIVDLKDLRNSSERILRDQFPAATVDGNGSKSIKISGGSLRRDVDVVPSVWFNSAEFQDTDLEYSKGVDILDAHNSTTIRNFPFKHIKMVDEKSLFTNDGSKMAIRLLKNVRSDSDKRINLSSYELAGLVHHCKDFTIYNHPGKELSILAGIDEFLISLTSHPSQAQTLVTPDGTRKILNKSDSLDSLRALSDDISNLRNEVFLELPNQQRIGVNLGFGLITATR